MKIDGKRIGWLDSCQMPSHIHRTVDEGLTTVCGHKPTEEPNWKITEVPRKHSGYSQYCKVCYKDGGKSLPWLKVGCPERIPKMLEEIGIMWRKHPDMRLGQLLSNAGALRIEGQATWDIFYLEDEELMRKMHVMFGDK